MKNKSINMLIVALLLLGLMAVMLIVFLAQVKAEFPHKIKVNENGVTDTVFKVRELRLNPTESKEYSVDLVCAASGSYYVTLTYEEISNGGMKPFVDVTVQRDGETVYTGNLAELIDNGLAIQFESELKAKDPVVITVRYEMPATIGNEAQGTFADFDLRIKIRKS